MQLAIFTHVEHIKLKSGYHAYSPYVREMNVWLRHVDKVEVVGPIVKTRPDENRDRIKIREQWIGYEHSKLTFTKVPSFNLLNFLSALKSVLKIPYILYQIIWSMRRADHLHLRCPGNVGLLACICQIFFPSKPKSAKYAGNWDPQAKQPWTYKLQKWILSNTFLTRNMQVLAYGNWAGQTKNMRPFFTASFSEGEIQEVKQKQFKGPFNFLFVGNLVEGKRALEAIKLVDKLNASENNSLQVGLEIFGNGPERERLEIYCKENGLEKEVIFKGSQPLDELKAAYQNAHFVVLPSRSEGWPKAIAEAMFFGCIPIATPVSCVPWMLDYGKRGILLSDQANGQKPKVNRSNQWSVVSGQWSDDLQRIQQLMTDPERMRMMSEEAKKWSQQYTLEKFEEALKEVLLRLNQEKTAANEIFSPAPFRGRGKTGKG